MLVGIGLDDRPSLSIRVPDGVLVEDTPRLLDLAEAFARILNLAGLDCMFVLTDVTDNPARECGQTIGESERLRRETRNGPTSAPFAVSSQSTSGSASGAVYDRAADTQSGRS
jgi:hypothetical protein